MRISKPTRLGAVIAMATGIAGIGSSSSQAVNDPVDDTSTTSTLVDSSNTTVDLSVLRHGSLLSEIMEKKVFLQPDGHTYTEYNNPRTNHQGDTVIGELTQFLFPNHKGRIVREVLADGTLGAVIRFVSEGPRPLAHSGFTL